MMKKYVYEHRKKKNLPLVMQLIKPESKQHYFSSNSSRNEDQIFIVEEIKMNLLAKSCFSPGFIALMQNLITS